ncbi:toll/interleukin-1 receptor domain-containing protein [Phytohabitans kaempferiae]|uniref:Toll/interleukin-1 receptor domain-containing protein n=1 Tax=Phytohabitans kaempferiae TaxID=1620943 RepID=A0ABV6MG41_9ACTN
MSDIFVSYRTDDETGVAILLDEKLCERFGPERVFRDNRSIGLGRDFRPELWGHLAKSTVFLVVAGPSWLARDEQGRRRIDDPDDFVRREIGWALKIGLRVVPVLVGDTPQLRADQLPDDIAELAHRQYRRLSSRGMQREIPLLIDDLAAILDAEAATLPPRPRPTDPGAEAPRRGTVAVLRPDSLDPAAAAAHVSALRDAIDLAADDANIPGVETAERPFGLTMFVPMAVAPIRVISGFLMSLEAALTAGRAPDGGPLRVTAAVGHGTVGPGHADLRDQLALLLGQPEVAAVRRRATRAGLVLVVSDEFYDGVVRAHPEAADPATYLPVPGPDGEHRSWVHVPGYPSPPGIRTAPQGGIPAPTPGSGVSFVNYGPVNGPQVGRDLHVHGDWVNRDKYVNGEAERR